MGLEFCVQAWEAGLLLYQTAKVPPPSVAVSVAQRWQFIACNECILELYHLRSRLAKIQSVKLRACPSIRETVDVQLMKSARKRLDEECPHIEALRHATAHRGENEAHASEHHPDGYFALSGFRQPDRYSTPYKGALPYLDITERSLRQIEGVVSEFFSAFDKLAQEFEQQEAAE